MIDLRQRDEMPKPRAIKSFILLAIEEAAKEEAAAGGGSSAAPKP